MEASLPSKLQAHHGLDYAGRGDDSARELARTELSALAAKHLPDLPSAKEMGIAPKVRVQVLFAHACSPIGDLLVELLLNYLQGLP